MLLLAGYAFDGEALGVPPVDRADDEVKAESELVGEHLVVFRESGVGILDAAREDDGLDSRERPGDTVIVVALTEGNVNW